MISKIWSKFVNQESVTYILFGVMTTLVDWVTYAVLREIGIDYRIATAVSWIIAVIFAFVTNKIFVFQSYEFHLGYLWKEFISFVTCRAATGIFTLLVMIVMVEWMHLNEFFGKVIISAISLVLNYLLSKLYIFKNNRDGEEEQDGA